MLRVRIETALMDGSLAVADVPGVWHEWVRCDLGLEVPYDGARLPPGRPLVFGLYRLVPDLHDRQHTAAQIMTRLKGADPGMRAALETGDTRPIRAALKDLVWRHGRSRSRREILSGIGAMPSDPRAYLEYLGKKPVPALEPIGA